VAPAQNSLVKQEKEVIDIKFYGGFVHINVIDIQA
jgi:hypothetical protein